MNALGRWPKLSDIAGSGGDPGRWWNRSTRRIHAFDTALGSILWEGNGPEPDHASKGPLAGVPIAVKDNIAVSGLPLTCGSKVLSGYSAPFNASAVKRLSDAGAVIVGKTNMDEFAMGSSTETSAFKPCRNPWDLERVPGGSSGGAAAAVAAGLVPVALGSDTGGSVRQPAAFCGVVGFKPSYGAISRYGLVSYGSSLDQIGVLSTSVGDAKTVFDVLRGPDGRDSTLAPTDAFSVPAPSAQRPRIGVLRNLSEHPAVVPEQRGALKSVVDAATSLGAIVEEVEVPGLDDTTLPAYYLTACAEASSNLARFDGIRYGPRAHGEFDDLFGLIRASRGAFGPEVRLRILLGTYVLRAGYYDRYYGKAQTARRILASSLEDTFTRFDFLLSPTVPGLPFRLGELLDDPVAMKLGDRCTVVANLAGLPAISLPIGIEEGLPTAIQIMAPRFADQHLLALAAEMEREIEFLPSLCPFMSRGPSVVDEGVA